MYSKRRRPPQLPIQVSSWMDKDITLKKVTANSRLLSNDSRQNIILSRQFFSDLLILSFSRYRKMAEHDFNKRMFLRNQKRKTEASMSGLHEYADQSHYKMSRPGTYRNSSDRQTENPFLSSSSHSLFSRPGTRPDTVANQRQPPPPLFRQVQTARMRKRQPDVTIVEPSPTNPAVPNRRPPTGRQMSRETLIRLSQPKGSRYKSAPAPHFVSNTTDSNETLEEIIAKIDETVPATTEPTTNETTLPDKPKGVLDDQRFHELMSSFAATHAPQNSQSRTLRSIVEANPALQDKEGLWKSEHPSLSSRKFQLEQRRQKLAEKLNRPIDVFVVEVGA